MGLLKRLFVPQPYELLFYSILSVSILFVSNLPYWFGLLVGTERVTLEPIFDTHIDDITARLANIQSLGTTATALFWSAVGAIVYALAWTAWNAYAELQDDVAVGTHFVNRLTTRQHYWGFVAGRIVFQAGMVILLVCFTTLTMTFLFPLARELFRMTLTYWRTLEYWPFIPASVLVLVIVCHAYAVLVRLVLRRARVFGNS